MNSRTVSLFSRVSTTFPLTSRNSRALHKLPRSHERTFSLSLALSRTILPRAFFQLYNYITVGSILPRVLLVFGVREYAWTRISRLARMVNFRKQKLPFYWVSSGAPLPRRSLGCPLPPTSLPANPPFLSFTPAVLHSSP